MKRLFIALALSAETRSAIASALGPFAKIDGIKWVPEEQLHITLAFLGNKGETESNIAADIVRNAPLLKVNIKPTGVGAFPSPKRPRIIWAGIKEEPAVIETYNYIAAGLKERGVSFDEKPKFIPHITVGRVKRPVSQSDILKIMQTTFDCPTENASGVILYESILERGGPRYIRLAERLLA